jgi:hypothetical protein
VSSAWPTDAEFSAAWLDQDAYGQLNRARLSHILARLSETYQSSKTERFAIQSELTIEHLLPQDWIANWPLGDGSRGMTWDELAIAAPDEPRASATRLRERAIHTMGNLTILTQALNSAVSNAEWKVKRPALMQASLLPINLQLQDYSSWDETAITRRGQALLERALRVWPGPSRPHS